MRNTYDRFIEKVNKTEGCWEWTAATYRGGYGHFRAFTDGKWKMTKAHRYSYSHFKGEIPKGMLVCHTCDNPKCVNPEHLFLGSHKDNMTDMHNKDRRRRKIPAIINGKKFLTKEIADNIRIDYKKGMSYNELVVKYLVSKPQVCRIVLNQIWK